MSEVAQLRSQAATWQQEAGDARLQLAGMQQAAAAAESAHQQHAARLGGQVQRREAELADVSARLARAQAQLAVLQSGSGGEPLLLQLCPTAELLARCAVSHTQLTAALSDAAYLLA